jgi:putative regulator of septum formation
MVAPAGVNEGSPQEPAKAGRASTELQDAQAAEAEPARATPAAPGPGKAGPGGTGPAPAEAAGKTVPAGAVPPQGGPAAVEVEPTEAGLAEQTEPEPTEAGLAGAAEAGLAEAEPAREQAEPTEAEQAEPTEPAEAVAPAEAGVAAPAEAGEAEAGWDEAEEERRDVSPLAVAGIIFGIIALVGVAIGVLAVVTHGFRPKTVITYRPAAAFGLRPGQCISSGTNALDVTVLSCARPHDAEVFATFSLPATAWPGTAAVQADASDGCASRFGSYLNPDLATVNLTQEFIYPNRTAWQAGERTVVCEVRSASGQLTGSVRANG